MPDTPLPLTNTPPAPPGSGDAVDAADWVLVLRPLRSSGSARPGHWEGREEARLIGARRGTVASAEVRSDLAAETYADLLPILKQAEGLSFRGIAGKLNEAGHKTRRGKPWNPRQVSRVLARNEAE